MEPSVATLIRAVEQADSSEKLCAAVAQLARSRQEEAIPTLMAVLGYNNPGASVIAVEGLIAIGEVAVPYMLENLDGYNYGARAWATRVFAGIGDPRALGLLLEAAKDDFALSVRRAAAKGLGSIRWQQVTENDRLPLQQQTLNILLQVTEDGEWVVRYAAIVGLQGLVNQQPAFRETVSDRLQYLLEHDEDLAVRARVKKAQIELFEMSHSS
jgi:phycocyanobilin lyase beta subunit